MYVTIFKRHKHDECVQTLFSHLDTEIMEIVEIQGLIY